MAATPDAFNAACELIFKTAMAQEASDFVDDGAGATRDIHANAYLILGATPEQGSSEVEQVSADADPGPLSEYQAARVLTAASSCDAPDPQLTA